MQPKDAPPAGGNWLKYAIPGIIVVVIIAFIGVWLTQDSGPHPVVLMQTSMGDIKLELFHDKAPGSVDNFLRYVDDKHYDGTIFHRVISGFMIQGGGFEPGMRKKRPKYPPIRNEAGNRLSNARGTIAMARTSDPDSATDEFFINTVDNPALDRANAQDKVGYAVFGKVIDGIEVVDKIRAVRVLANDMGEKAIPAEDIIIKSVRRVETK
jgi:cyclophilin family peptidyl-prolyl cis-trans isomerase